jgi:hypothetical protein
MAFNMTADQATQAGALAASIKSRQEKIAQIQAMITAGNFQVSQFAVIDSNNSPISLILDVLDAQTSQAALQYALNVYQTQLTALQAQLAAI